MLEANLEFVEQGRLERGSEAYGSEPGVVLVESHAGSRGIDRRRTRIPLMLVRHHDVDVMALAEVVIDFERELIGIRKRRNWPRITGGIQPIPNGEVVRQGSLADELRHDACAIWVGTVRIQTEHADGLQSPRCSRWPDRVSTGVDGGNRGGIVCVNGAGEESEIPRASRRRQHGGRGGSGSHLPVAVIKSKKEGF